jgi:hypothetical protein
VTEKRDINHSYSVHGDDVASMTRGFMEIGMPSSRHAAALEIVRDVMVANKAREIRWYVTHVPLEVCGYWDAAEQNQMWIWPGVVAVLAILDRPLKPINYSRGEGELVGWLLPGGEAGAGGGPRRKAMGSIRCPKSGIRQPVGSVCPDCDVIHN